MQVLVIGGTGFLSSAVVDELVGAGHEITVYTRGRRSLPPYGGEVKTLTGDRKDVEAFVTQLLGMYHQRVAYPQNKVVEIESRRGTGTGTGA